MSRFIDYCKIFGVIVIVCVICFFAGKIILSRWDIVKDYRIRYPHQVCTYGFSGICFDYMVLSKMGVCIYGDEKPMKMICGEYYILQ